MKLLLIAITLLAMVSNAFAGDSYFICTHIDRTGEPTGSFIVDKYIDSSSDELILASYYDLNSGDDLYQFSYNQRTSEFTGDLYDIHGGGLRSTVTQKLEYQKLVAVSKSVACFIAD